MEVVVCRSKKKKKKEKNEGVDERDAEKGWIFVLYLSNSA